MNSNLGEIYIQSVIKRLQSYKDLGDKTFAQLEEKDFQYQPNPESNSIGVIIKHMSGNMLSRFTNFLTEDGEKQWRNRDAEFEDGGHTKEQLIDGWEKGWAVVFEAIRSLTEADLTKTVYIRTEALTVVDALNRQLAHYPHHVGQIIYIGKLLRGNLWESLSIPKGQSDLFNKRMATDPK
jgi:hypothetical protein